MPGKFAKRCQVAGPSSTAISLARSLGRGVAWKHEGGGEMTQPAVKPLSQNHLTYLK